MYINIYIAYTYRQRQKEKDIDIDIIYISISASIYLSIYLYIYISYIYIHYIHIYIYIYIYISNVLRIHQFCLINFLDSSLYINTVVLNKPTAQKSFYSNKHRTSAGNIHVICWTLKTC